MKRLFHLSLRATEVRPSKHGWRQLRRGLITPKKAALADLISPPLEDGRHAVQPHRDHVVDGDD